MPTNNTFTEEIINLALKEDCIQNDITTNSMLDFDQTATGIVTAKQAGIVSGIDIFKRTFSTVDPAIIIQVLKTDGSRVKKGDTVIILTGPESTILRGERTALNFLARLSGIATLTSLYVRALKGTGTTLLDTRKTTPGMRYLEKEAVLHGGGKNHRKNLEEMAMIKDNHIKMAGSIKTAVEKVRQNNPGKQIEVEVKNIPELKQALQTEAEIIMLDNFSLTQLKEAVKIKPNKVNFEVSGNITLENIRERALPGIDYISVGALTHSFPAMDFSLNIKI